MTDISQEERDLIDRYLANRLTGREAQMVETRIVEDRVFRNEVELAAAFREGLRALQDRGELTPLLSPRRPLWRRQHFALAASAAAVALGLASFLLVQRFDAGSGAAVHETLVFLQTRGASGGADAAWTRTGDRGSLELRFDVGLEPAPAYEVLIRRGMSDEVLRGSATTLASGEAVLRADAAFFVPGDYAIRLTAPGSSAPIEFTLRVTPRR